MIQDRMKECREQKKLTQVDIAKRLNITRQAYNHYETGKRKPSADVITALAEFYDISTDYLLGNTDDPTPPDKKKPTPETVGPILTKMLKEQGYLQDDQPLTDEEAAQLLKIAKAVRESMK